MVLLLFKIVNNREAIKSRWKILHHSFLIAFSCSFIRLMVRTCRLWHLLHVTTCHPRSWFISLSVVTFFTVIYYFKNLMNFHILHFVFNLMDTIFFPCSIRVHSPKVWCFIEVCNVRGWGDRLFLLWVFESCWWINFGTSLLFRYLNVFNQQNWTNRLEDCFRFSFILSIESKLNLRNYTSICI